MKKLLLALILALASVSSYAQAGASKCVGVIGCGGGGSSSLVPGSTVVSGADTRVLFDDAGLLGEDAGFTYNKTTDFLSLSGGLISGTVTTAGRSILTIRDTITGASATSNFLNVTGAFNSTLSAATNAIYLTVAFDNDAQQQAGIKAISTGVGGSQVASPVFSDAQNTGAFAIGAYNLVSGAATTSVGTWGTASAGTNRVGGYFNLQETAGPGSTAALVADNNAVAANIFEARDNGTPVFTIGDGGTSTFTQQLTASAGLILGVNQVVNMGSLGYIYPLTSLTPDSLYIAPSATSSSMHYAELADSGFDFANGACGTAACTDPGLIIHSAVQDTTQYNHLSAWGQAGGALKALTAAAATALVRIPVPTNSRASGELVYEIYATDGTDMQVRSSRIRYAMTNKAGTEACTLTAFDGAAASDETNDDNAANITAGTLTYGIACTNNAADTMDITFNAVSSLVETTLSAKWSVVHLSPGQPARQ